MPDPNSPFYPPRAPWYAPAREAGHAALAATRVRKVPTPGSIGLGRFLLRLVLPGYGFVVHGQAKLGAGAMVAWPFLMLLGVAFLGESAGNLLFGIAISIHATSLVHLLRPWLTELSFGYRMASMGVAVAGLVVFGYLPIKELVDRTLFRPIASDRGSVVVYPTRDAKAIRRGDWIVYHHERRNFGNVIAVTGTSFGEVLALPGDTVEFTPDAVRVNGKPLPRQNHMPDSGSVTVDPERWFVWPRLSHIQHGNVDEGSIRSAILVQASVPFANLRARPFARWFHRQQIIETP